jgi:IclR family acetate operon transcriptional repressor
MRRTGSQEGPDLSIEAVERAIAVLERVAQTEQAQSLQKIAVETGIAKSTVYRLLLTWERLGYVERVGPSSQYRLGVRAMELGRNVASRNRLATLTQPLLLRLHEQFRESVYLGLYRKGKVILIDAIQSTQVVRVTVDLGETCLLHASAQGRAVAAFLEAEALARLLEQTGLPRITTKTNTDPVRLAQILADIRVNGYAINWEETVEGCVCVGAPFFSGRGGSVLGSIGISTPLHRVTEESLAQMVDEIKAIADEISGRLVEFVAEPECLSVSQASHAPGFLKPEETAGRSALPS